MTALEIVLILVACICIFGSFFLTEKISPKDLQRSAELSEEEIRKIVEKELEKARTRIASTIDDTIEESVEKTEVAIDKETNEKIKAIQEYSDTVMTDMNKAHDEVMFLYSMLNDRHDELVQMSANLQSLVTRLQEIQREQQAYQTAYEQKMTEMHEKDLDEQLKSVQEEVVVVEETPVEEEEVEEEPPVNHNDYILDLWEQGKSAVEIAKELGLGVGEVNLVLGLYKGEEKL